MTNQDTSDDRGIFPILDQLDFFNHAGVAPISGAAAQALRDYAQQASERAYFKSDWYAKARKIKNQLAQFIGAQSGREIAYVPNTSAGLSIVARGLDWVEGDNVVITDVEYPANRYPWKDLERLGVEVIEVRQQPDGRIDVDEVCEAITRSTRVVSISHVQYASGHRIDLKPISDMVHRAGGYLCVDAIQSVGALPVDVEAMGIDFLSADGHKWLLSPEGCGLFYCREELCEMLRPSVVGWMNMVNATDFGNYQFEFEPHAQRFEPGSYNIPGILALSASVELLSSVGIDNIWQRIDALTTRLCEGLASKGYQIITPRDNPDERSGIVVFSPPEGRGAPQQIVAELEKQNVIIVVRNGQLRASPHYYNTPEQIDRLIAALP